MTGIKVFKQFVIDCRQYEKQTKNHSKKRKTSKNVKSADQGIELNQEDQDSQSKKRNSSQSKGEKDFPPVIPEQVTSIPFGQLFLSPSFQYFLQFHNDSLPNLIKGKTVPGLLIENFKYYLKLQDNLFAMYDWHDKKLSFGKGNPKTFEGKQLKFHKHYEQIDDQTKQITVDKEIRHVKTVFIGIVENGKYSKNGFFLDKTQIYEGDFYKGVKQGYGKLTNTIHKYIGNFQQDLYSGQGQLVTEKQIYVGQFKQGLRNGCGKNQSYQNGLNYDGEWLNDKPQGNGTMKNSQNTEIIGVFYQGKVDEQYQVSLRYQDGRIYKGQIKDGKQNGQGFIVGLDGKLRMGQFKDGQLIQETLQSQEKFASKKLEKQQTFSKNQQNQTNKPNQAQVTNIQKNQNIEVQQKTGNN